METSSYTPSQCSDHNPALPAPHWKDRTPGSPDAQAEVPNGVVPDVHEQSHDRRRSEPGFEAAHELALATARAEELERELELLRAAMHTRNIIGQAQGLLMERSHVNADEAFNMLVRLSQRSHVKLRDIAARLVQARHEARSAHPSRRRHE